MTAHLADSLESCAVIDRAYSENDNGTPVVQNQLMEEPQRWQNSVAFRTYFSISTVWRAPAVTRTARPRSS